MPTVSNECDAKHVIETLPTDAFQITAVKVHSCHANDDILQLSGHLDLLPVTYQGKGSCELHWQWPWDSQGMAPT